LDVLSDWEDEIPYERDISELMLECKVKLDSSMMSIEWKIICLLLGDYRLEYEASQRIEEEEG
jgi:hypothetical protein